MTSVVGSTAHLTRVDSSDNGDIASRQGTKLGYSLISSKNSIGLLQTPPSVVSIEVEREHTSCLFGRNRNHVVQQAI
jgi:hypothetical protein